MRSCNVAKLNNEAIALFRNGNHEDAIWKLKVAVKEIVGIVKDRSVGSNKHSLFEMPTKGPSLDASLRRNCCTMPAGHPFMPVPSKILLPVSIKRDATSRESQSASAFYSCAVALPEVCSDSFPEHFVARASVTVLYNLAFMNHWQAFHLGVTSGILKALQLYSMALKMIPPEENFFGDIDHLAMAIWNNMGHVYAHLMYQLHEAQVCFDRLGYLLAHRDGLRCWLPKQDYETFFLSAMFQGSDLLLAAAA